MRVVTLDAPGARSFDVAEGLDVKRVPALAAGHRPSIARLNARAIREALSFRPDLVLSMHVVTAPAAITIGKGLRRPFVQYLHADEVGHRPTLARLALRSARASIAVSRHTRDLAVALGAPPRRLYRIPPGVDPPRRAGAQRCRRPRLLTVSRLEDRYKGHDVVVQAMPMIRERVPGVIWIVIGEGSLRPWLDRLVAHHGVQDCVRFLGLVPDAERETWLERAHVFVMPSRLPAERPGGEGFGIAYLEAAIHGLPVVAGSVGGARDAVADGQTGLLVDPEDPVAVADAVCGLLLRPERAEAMGQAAAERARAYLWPKVTAQVEEVLLTVLDGPAYQR
jgi:phosphatidylinositol alpha-1,6-mannosyltransferase